MKEKLFCLECNKMVKTEWVLGTKKGYYVIACDICDNISSSDDELLCIENWNGKQFDKKIESYTVSGEELIKQFNDWKNSLTYVDMIEHQFNKRAIDGVKRKIK